MTTPDSSTQDPATQPPATQPQAPATPPRSDGAVHPGAALADELAARGLTQRALAEAMGRPIQVVNEIARGRKAVTAATALQFEGALAIPAEFWLNLQAQFDLARARQEAGRNTRAAPSPAGLEETRHKHI